LTIPTYPQFEDYRLKYCIDYLNYKNNITKKKQMKIYFYYFNIFDDYPEYIAFLCLIVIIMRDE